MQFSFFNYQQLFVWAAKSTWISCEKYLTNFLRICHLKIIMWLDSIYVSGFKDVLFLLTVLNIKCWKIWIYFIWLFGHIFCNMIGRQSDIDKSWKYTYTYKRLTHFLSRVHNYWIVRYWKRRDVMRYLCVIIVSNINLCLRWRIHRYIQLKQIRHVTETIMTK